MRSFASKSHSVPTRSAFFLRAVARERPFFAARAVRTESLQTKPAAGEPGEHLEREAETAADRVANHPQAFGEPAMLPQPGLRDAAGGGRALPRSARTEMEAALRADLSAVRVHDDEGAAQLADGLDAQAFAHGSHLYFNRGEFQPHTRRGRHLLAHELTHVLQQAAGRTHALQRRTFTPGRPAHDHKPGHWAAVQSAARRKCALTLSPIECTCAAASPATVINLAMRATMRDKPLARQHLDHYLAGGGLTLIEDAPLKWLIEHDAKIRAKLGTAIAGARTGTTDFWQSDYDNQDFRFAWGGIDRVDFDVHRAAGTVDVWFMDRYDFHPVGFGYVLKGTGDFLRSTNCVHAAAVELKSSGAADYWMKGETTVPLSLFASGGPSGSGPSL